MNNENKITVLDRITDKRTNYNTRISDTISNTPATDNIITTIRNNNYRVRANYYNNEIDYDIAGKPVVDEYETQSPKNIKLSAYAGVGDYMPCVAVEYYGGEYINGVEPTGGINLNEGFSCTFKAEDPFFENDGYNGCINFTWTNNSLGMNAVPENCIGSNYNNASQLNSEGNYLGLFDNSLEVDTMNGFSLTFFPSSSYEHIYGNYIYTTRLNRYVLSYKTVDGNVAHKVGYLPVNINIFDDEGAETVNTELSIEHSLGNYNFYLNGIMFSSVEENVVDMRNWGNNNGFFTASVINTPYIEANLEIVDIVTEYTSPINEHINNEAVHLTPEEKENIQSIPSKTSELENDSGFLTEHQDISGKADISMLTEHTNDLGIHVTEDEKINLNSLGTSVKAYGAIGDGSNNDTTAFVNALNNGGVIYVPKGTYIINEDLHLKPGTELRMTKETVIKTTGSIIMHRWTQMTSGIIRVPFDYTESAILINTELDSENQDISPMFVGGTPVLRTGRKIDGTTILKSGSENSDQTFADTIKSIGGIGIELIANPANVEIETEDGLKTVGVSGALWNVDINANICGAFEKGIYARIGENETELDDGWINDLKLSGITEACRVGVHLENVSNAFCDVIIQPNAATHYSDGSDIPNENVDYTKIVYAENGYRLENCKACTLLKARVWDWDYKRTRCNESDEYKRIALIGDCSGLIINDFIYTHSSTDIRDKIYSNPIDNLDSMVVLQEPVTKYFKKSEEDKPIFNNGESSKELVLKDYFDEHFKTEKLYYYEDNILPNSKPGQDELLNKMGYLVGNRIDADVNNENNQNFIITGYIDCTPGTTLYLKGLAVDNSAHYGNKIIYYYENSTKIQALNTNHIANATYFINYERDDNNISKMTIPNTDTNKDLEGVCSMRICCHIDDVNEPIVSTKPITCTPKGYITDNIYVKEKFVEKQSTINTDSTNDQIPSAKAVYDLLESALGEYITDVADLVGGEV